MTGRRENNIRRGARAGRFWVVRPAFRGDWAAFAARLSADAAVFAVVASAITLAVLTQDPGARAAPVRPPAQERWPVPPVVSQQPPRTPGSTPAWRGGRGSSGFAGGARR
jgi:hypothetical protein